MTHVVLVILCAVVERMSLYRLIGNCCSSPMYMCMTLIMAFLTFLVHTEKIFPELAKQGAVDLLLKCLHSHPEVCK